VCLLGEVLADAFDYGNLPGEAFSILPCELEDAAEFSENEHIKVLSFTGSTKIGWALRATAGHKKVVLELGGDAACIVDAGLSEAELEHAADRIAFGAFYQAGQSCISVQRVIVHDSCYERLRTLLIERAAKLAPSSDLLDPSTEFGPLISESDAIRVQSWIAEASEHGATVLTGGLRDGPFVLPTIVENVDRTKCRLGSEEVFGPVALLERFGRDAGTKETGSDIDEAVSIVNASKYGLQTGIFTPSMKNAFYAFNHLEVGGVVVNDIPSTRIDSQPYGGVKESGIGREGVRFAMEDFSEPRIMLLKGMNP
jgi:acyl-CoA reductase-like NAD-dependent aldehyde dehydrogenase